MRLFPTSRAVVIALLVLWSSNPSQGAEKDKTVPDKGVMHTIDARVTYSSGSNAGTNILAERQPGQFTIPKGSQATKLKYSFADPKSDYTSTKLRGNSIYSVTEKRYMHELDADPNFALPPGEYKFVVGGLPGASGTLTYTTVPTNDRDSPPKTPPPHGTTKRKPPEKMDKTEDKSTVTVLPEGAKKKKVVVDFFEAQRPCKLDAWLTTDHNKMTLDFIVPGLQNEFSVTKATSRWEGILETTAGSTTASGKTNFENITNYKSGKSARVWMKGTFTATLEGNVLTGSIEDSGQLEAAEGGVGPVHSKARWRIEGFSP